MFSCVPSSRRITKVLSSISILAATLVCLGTPALAEDEPAGERFQFHGFLTQAYATANFTDLGPTPDEVILGIPEDGTSSYRFLAMQFRYEISDRDLVVIQLSSRALGDSPISSSIGRSTSVNLATPPP